jgi:hypothetical protein
VLLNKTKDEDGTMLCKDVDTLDSLVDFVVIFGVELHCDVGSSVERELSFSMYDIVEEIIDPVEDTILDTRDIFENDELDGDISLVLVVSGFLVVMRNNVVDVSNSIDVVVLISELLFDVNVNIDELESRVPLELFRSI